MARFSILRLLLISALVFNISLLRPALAEEGGTIQEETAAGTESAEDVVDVEESETEEVEEAVADAVPDEVVEEATEEVTEPVKETVKEKVAVSEKTGKIGVVKDKIQELVGKVKSLDKPALKKIAAGAIGVWGVSVAVGWLTKGNPGAAAQKKKR